MSIIKILLIIAGTLLYFVVGIGILYYLTKPLEYQKRGKPYQKPQTKISPKKHLSFKKQIELAKQRRLKQSSNGML